MSAKITARKLVERAHDDCSLLAFLLSHGRTSELADNCRMSMNLQSYLNVMKRTDDEPSGLRVQSWTSAFVGLEV